MPERLPLRFPQLYLLSSPFVVRQQFGQRRRRVEIVCFENRAASAGNIRELQIAVQEPLDGRFVGRVEHRSAGACAPGDVESQGQRGKAFEVGGLELELEALRTVE